MTWASAKKVTTPHIWKQTNVGFRHGHLRSVCHDAHTGALTDAHATAHHHTIHKSNVGFGVGVNQMVQGIFFCEEVA